MRPDEEAQGFMQPGRTRAFGYAKQDPVARRIKAGLYYNSANKRSFRCKIGSYPAVKEAIQPGADPRSVHDMAGDMVAAFACAFEGQALRIVARPAMHLRAGDLGMELEAERRRP